jgi:hypothetical protein
VRSATKRAGLCLPVALAACAGGGAAFAHTMGVTPYDLPMPFSLYVYACAITLLLTFAVLACVPTAPAVLSRPSHSIVGLGRLLPAAGQAGAVALLGLTIAAGLWGTPSPVANIAPTLFWVGMMLGLAVVTAVLGDVFQIVNPWRVLLRLLHVGARPLRRYPPALASWPAFTCYLALSWLELMAPPRPSLLAWALLAYTGLTAGGAALFGRDAWFRHAELFSVFFRISGMLAPIAYTRSAASEDGNWHARTRPLLAGTLEDRPHHISHLLFVLFMLAGTTYDGVWQTSFWAGLYWQNLMAWLRPLWGDDMARAQALLAPGYVIYQQGGLIAAPFVYLAVYLMVMAVMRVATGGRMPTRALALRFAFSMVPIALAYMLAHSWTLLLTVLPVIPFLLSDPFGAGWNLLGLQRVSADPPPIDMGQAWHIEVALILLGHIASVYLAHVIAQRTFPSRRQIWLSELPLVLLMMGYTFVGLSVLSLPLILH